MLSDKLQMFSNRILKVYRHRSKQARRMGIRCYRLYDKDLPEFPVTIDLYDDKVCLSEYKAKHSLSEEAYREWMEGTIHVIALVLQLPEEHIYTKERRRIIGRHAQYQKTGEEQVFFEVMEQELRFWVNLSDYLDTGLFLDHRITRKMVQEEASGKRVLNLFAYTGSFSVYAAAGGAVEVTTVDLSNTYTEWARRNMELNGFIDPDRFRFVVADVKQYLPTLEAGSMDLIVMDPPTFSNSKKMKDILDVQADHVELINQALRVLQPGGVLYFSNNATRFQLNQDALHASEVKELTKATTPFDFEGKLKRWCWRMISR